MYVAKCLRRGIRTDKTIRERGKEMNKSEEAQSAVLTPVDTDQPVLIYDSQRYMQVSVDLEL